MPFNPYSNPIGRTDYSLVSKVTHRKLGPVAVKLDFRGVLGNELLYLNKLQHHPNVIQVYGRYQSLLLKGIVMELMSYNLSQVIEKTYGPRKMYSWFYQLCSALAAMHEMGHIHRDVKPNNVLLNEEMSIVKLIDFGVSQADSRTDMTTRVGTLPFMAPEVAEGSSNYSISADVYSLGITIFVTATKQSYAVDWKNKCWDWNKKISDEFLRTAVDRMLEKKTEKRPSMRRLRDYFAKLVKENICDESFLEPDDKLVQIVEKLDDETYSDLPCYGEDDFLSDEESKSVAKAIKDGSHRLVSYHDKLVQIVEKLEDETYGNLTSGSASWDDDPVPRALTTDPMSVGSSHEDQSLPSQVTDTTNPHVPKFDIQTVTIKEKLGGGSFSVCYKVYECDLGTCVMKLPKQNYLQLDSTRDALFQQRREFLHYVMLNHHPNIVSFYGYVHTTGRPNYPEGFLMEFMQGGNLFSYLQHDHPMPLELLNHWAKQIAQGLSFMHRRGIMHRNLNPNNILLSRDYHVAKISDFGLAKKQEAADITYRNTVKVGTAVYRAPEVFVDNKYRYPVDVYSYGMTLYFIYYRRHPFEHDFFHGLSPFIAQQKLSGAEGGLPIRPQLGLLGDRLAAQDELIQMCWRSNPAERPTILNVVGIFNMNSNLLPAYYSLSSTMLQTQTNPGLVLLESTGNGLKG